MRPLRVRRSVLLSSASQVVRDEGEGTPSLSLLSQSSQQWAGASGTDTGMRGDRERGRGSVGGREAGALCVSMPSETSHKDASSHVP